MPAQTSSFTKNHIPKHTTITVEEDTSDTIHLLQHNNLVGSVGSGSQPILIPSFPPLKNESTK